MIIAFVAFCCMFMYLPFISADQLLPHHFVATSIVKGMVCDVCHKGFTGFMKHSLRCTGKHSDMVKRISQLSEKLSKSYFLANHC